MVVPCYNEAQRLDSETFRRFIECTPDIKFLFVNDGSQDATLKVLEQLRQGLEPSVTILDKHKNGGKGEAVRDGMLYAFDKQHAEIAGFWDADLATPLDAIHDLAQVLTSRPEIQMVFGSKYSYSDARLSVSLCAIIWAGSLPR
ncbi:MAG: glycosyltransferase [Bryobacteraceae bacterium]